MGYLVYKISSQKWNINKNMNIYVLLLSFFQPHPLWFSNIYIFQSRCRRISHPSFWHSSHTSAIYSIIPYVNCMQIMSGFAAPLHITEPAFNLRDLHSLISRKLSVSAAVLVLNPALMITLTHDSHAYKHRRWGILIEIQHALEDIELIWTFHFISDFMIHAGPCCRALTLPTIWYFWKKKKQVSPSAVRETYFWG